MASPSSWGWAARFLAPAATVSGIVAVVFRALYDWWSRWRAMLSTGHVVVLGGGPETTRLALEFRRDTSAGRKDEDVKRTVICVGEVTAEQQIELREAGVRWLNAASEAELMRILKGSDRVVIAAPDDQEASSLTSRVQELSRKLGEDPEVVTLVSSHEVARDWHYVGNDRVICRAEQVARIVLRLRAPFDEDRVTPPPLVLGDGRLAAELVARIFEGWQQPGESITVHCGGPDSARTRFTERGLGFSGSDASATLRHDDGPQGLGTLVWHDLPAGTHLAVRAAERVLDDWCASWSTYGKHREYETGPMPVYVAFDDDATTIPVANAIKRALGVRVRVVVVPKDRALAEHLCVGIKDNPAIQAPSASIIHGGAGWAVWPAC